MCSTYVSVVQSAKESRACVTLERLPVKVTVYGDSILNLYGETYDFLQGQRSDGFLSFF